ATLQLRTARAGVCGSGVLHPGEDRLRLGVDAVRQGSHKPVLLEAEHVCTVGAELGEWPIWVPRDSALWFVDIKGGFVRRYEPATGSQTAWQAPSKPGFI